MLRPDGQAYNLTEVVFENGTANEEGIHRLGIPFFTASFVLGKSMSCLATTSSITTALFFTFFTLKRKFKEGFLNASEKICPHRSVTMHLPDMPM